jgi:hypothetical protein
MPVETNTMLRKGDVVTVRGVVEYADAETIAVKIGYQTVYPALAELELVEAKFNVGETAWDRAKDYYVNVLALNKGEAWVESLEGFRQSYVAKVSDLERTSAELPNEPAKEDPANVPGVHAAADHAPYDALAAVKANLNADPNIAPAFAAGVTQEETRGTN